MGFGRTTVAVLAGALLLGSGSAAAQGRGGGAGTADASGATQAGSGGETKPQPKSAKKARKPAHEKTPAKGVEAEGTGTTGGGR